MIRFKNVKNVIFFTAVVRGSEQTFQVVSKRLRHCCYEAYLYIYSYEDYRFVCLPTPVRYTKNHLLELQEDVFLKTQDAGFLLMQGIAKKLLVLNHMISNVEEVDYEYD